MDTDIADNTSNATDDDVSIANANATIVRWAHPKNIGQADRPAFYHQLSSLTTPSHWDMLNEVKTKTSNLIQ